MRYCRQLRDLVVVVETVDGWLLLPQRNVDDNIELTLCNPMNRCFLCPVSS